jgi:hypothetical protein
MRRGPGERLAAWIYTGPLGHFWSTAADLACFSLARVRARRRRDDQR